MESVMLAQGPNPLMILPFGILLATIALAPLFFADWWGKHYPKVTFGLGAVTVAYYLFSLHAGGRVVGTAHEYFSFIALIGSLFVVSGGIHFTIKGEATPRENVIFLLFGAVVANLLGTTGASMLLIRPWIRMNRYRVTAHHVVFFIFLVSNVGGCLTPIGDPPLFLGYLKGVPFWWVAQKCLPMWATGVAVLLVMFYVVDSINYKKAPKEVREALAEPKDVWQFQGLSNLAFLAAILGSVFINNPPFLREAIMIAAALGSYYTTSKQVHAANDFNFHPIKEVAILFAGIFSTMMPALDWLQANASRLGELSPGMFYWASGILSSVLDNAPTYLSFLSAAIGAFVSPDLLQQVQQAVQSGGATLASIAGDQAETVRQAYAALQKYHSAALAAKSISVDQIQVAILLGSPVFSQFIVAVSTGAVFFGANTYIGNGPNFMVKAIADQQKVNTPSFLGYVFRFTLPVMLPMLVIVWLLFFLR
jgi:Na+/H+ antiporter NhaD/arsenite permease-like protein